MNLVTEIIRAIQKEKQKKLDLVVLNEKLRQEHLFNKEREKRLKEEQERENELEQIRKQFHHMTFNVAGVTFKNGRKTRQAILRKIRFKDEPFNKIETIEFEPYEFEGEQAYYIQVNGETIGNIPRTSIAEFEKYKDQNMTVTELDVAGGREYPFGCTITLKFNEFSD